MTVFKFDGWLQRIECRNHSKPILRMHACVCLFTWRTHRSLVCLRSSVNVMCLQAQHTVQMKWYIESSKLCTMLRTRTWHDIYFHWFAIQCVICASAEAFSVFSTLPVDWFEWAARVDVNLLNVSNSHQHKQDQLIVIIWRPNRMTFFHQFATIAQHFNIEKLIETLRRARFCSFLSLFLVFGIL